MSTKVKSTSQKKASTAKASKPAKSSSTKASSKKKAAGAAHAVPPAYPVPEDKQTLKTDLKKRCIKFSERSSLVNLQSLWRDPPEDKLLLPPVVAASFAWKSVQRTDVASGKQAALVLIDETKKQYVTTNGGIPCKNAAASSLFFMRKTDKLQLGNYAAINISILFVNIATNKPASVKKEKKRAKPAEAEDVPASKKPRGDDHAPAPDTRKKYALCIGNNKYTKCRPLINCVSDATAIAEHLRRLGYTTTLKPDVKTSTQLRKHVDDFSRQLVDGAMVIIFFAGHAQRGQHGNELLACEDDNPTTAAPKDKFTLQWIHEVIKRTKKKLDGIGFFLDSCRVLTDGLTRDGDEKKEGNPMYDAQGNLTHVPAHWGTLETFGTNSFYAFSCGPGQKAYDGDPPEEDDAPGHGRYTMHLLNVLNHYPANKKQPDVHVILRRVCELVSHESKNKQRPWFNDSIHKHELPL